MVVQHLSGGGTRDDADELALILDAVKRLCDARWEKWGAGDFKLVLDAIGIQTNSVEGLPEWIWAN